MIRDLLHERPDPATTRDVCIVGAGAAGIALAVELARLGRSVTLLEAGGQAVEESAQDPAQGSVAGLPHRGLHGGRVRALGGTTNLWGGQVLELDDTDFDQRPWVRGSGWPFPKRELARHYTRALAIEGLAEAKLEDDAVWHALRMAVPQTGSLCTYLSRWCPEPNFAKLHRNVLDGEKIEVWMHANACELMLEGTEAKGIRCRTRTGLESIFRGRTYVFCLGAIESSRFFLQPRGHCLPWNESGLLGRHFQDHIDCNAATVELLRPSVFHESFDAIFLGRFKYNPKVKLSPQIEEQHQRLRAGATFYSQASNPESDVLTLMKSAANKFLRGQLLSISPRETGALLRQVPLLVRHSYRYAVQHRSFHPSGAPMTMRVHCEQEPMGSSSIGLCDERDEFGLLRTRLGWRISPRELRTIREFVQTAAEELRSIARIHPHPGLLSDSFQDECQDGYHHMSGMRMSDSPRLGVVSPELRLHGTGNAYVCSSAVFPCSGFSNPTHTLIALAMRLAERLAAS